MAASRTWWTSASTVYVASAEAFPDALSAGPAAARDKAPLLLTPRASTPTSVTGEIKRLGATKAVIVGGESAVSAEAEAQLRAAGVSVTRIAGRDRYETNAAVARTFRAATKAYLASGLAFADATSGGAAASTSGVPLLLTAPTSVPSTVSSAMKDLGVDTVDVVGGTSVVSSSVSTSLGSTLGTRYAGPDRYTTAAKLMASVAKPGSPLILTSGENWPDSLVAGPVVKKIGGFMLPTRSTCMPAVISQQIARLRPASTTALGGQNAVSDSARTTVCS